MLVLTRKAGQSVMIGDDIQVTILSGKGGQIRIGFDAPKEIIIRREEIYEQTKAKPRLENTDNRFYGLALRWKRFWSRANVFQQSKKTSS